MSSTLRGYKRHASDYYRTPPEAIKLFLSHWLEYLRLAHSAIGERPDKVIWFDPCAGGKVVDGKTVEIMPYPEVLEKGFDVNVGTVDIREDSPADITGDFLNMEFRIDDSPQVVITNPPFYSALEFITKSLEIVTDGGYVVMLLRLNFFGSQKRFPFFQNHMPDRCYIHHRRMSFSDNGKTDSIEYAHFVWQKGLQPNFTKVKVI